IRDPLVTGVQTCALPICIRPSVLDRLAKVFAGLRVGNPLDDGVLVGPLIDEAAGEAMDRALKAARAAGGTVYGGGWVMDDVPEEIGRASGRKRGESGGVE